jgi:hypothetical protein
MFLSSRQEQKGSKHTTLNETILARKSNRKPQMPALTLYTAFLARKKCRGVIPQFYPSLFHPKSAFAIHQGRPGRTGRVKTVSRGEEKKEAIVTEGGGGWKQSSVKGSSNISSRYSTADRDLFSERGKRVLL